MTKNGIEEKSKSIGDELVELWSCQCQFLNHIFCDTCASEFFCRFFVFWFSVLQKTLRFNSNHLFSTYICHVLDYTIYSIPYTVPRPIDIQDWIWSYRSLLFLWLLYYNLIKTILTHTDLVGDCNFIRTFDARSSLTGVQTMPVWIFFLNKRR